MSTLAVTVLVAGIVIFAAVIALALLGFRGLREGYSLAASVRWAPKPPPKGQPPAGGAS